ncbi:MAG: isochorismatase family cysteine hydrolase [Beijerinckiaceae bacterium]|nr:isochorismatase family cysteine hydrolase [Beijerinckiaceae bacterium]
MHPFAMPQEIVSRVTARAGRPHPFDVLTAARTALLVIDMQNYFMKPGYPGETPTARTIVPGVNQLAAALRRMGGIVVWIKNSATDTRENWSVLHRELMTPEKQKARYEALSEDHEGHELWPMLDVKSEDVQMVKKRFSAFIQGSSDLGAFLHVRGFDTVLIAGTATNICCESTARDAMMLNFRTVMVSDALAAYSDAEHAAALMNFYTVFGDVQSIDETIASLAHGARRYAAA